MAIRAVGISIILFATHPCYGQNSPPVRWCTPATDSVLPTSLVPSANTCTNPAVLTSVDRATPPSPNDPRLLAMLFLANAAYLDVNKHGQHAVDSMYACLQNTWGAVQRPVLIEKPIPSSLSIKGTAAVLLMHTSNNNLFIAFRGSDDMGDWAKNLDARPRDARAFFNASTGPVHVHNGFLSIYQLLHADIVAYIDQHIADGTRIFVTGHSLGAALATLSALKLSQMYSPYIAGVYPFSSPRVGMQNFRILYNDQALGGKTLRTWYGDDLVTRLPPKVDDDSYVHVGMGLGVCGGAALDAQGQEVAMPLELNQERWCIGASAVATMAHHWPSVLWDGLVRALPGLVVGNEYGGCVLKAMTMCPGAHNDNCRFLGRCGLATEGRCLTCSGDATCRGYWQQNVAGKVGGRCQAAGLGRVRRCVVN